MAIPPRPNLPRTYLKSARRRKARGKPLAVWSLPGLAEAFTYIRFGTGLFEGRLLCGGSVRFVALYERYRTIVAR